MADLFLSKAVDLTTTNATTVYTVPTSDDSAVPKISPTTSILKSIRVANDSGSADPMVLQETDIIKATAATANRLHVILSVMEIT